jgi:hypothetical protein
VPELTGESHRTLGAVLSIRGQQCLVSAAHALGTSNSIHARLSIGNCKVQLNAFGLGIFTSDNTIPHEDLQSARVALSIQNTTRKMIATTQRSAVFPGQISKGSISRINDTKTLVPSSWKPHVLVAFEDPSSRQLPTPFDIDQCGLVTTFFHDGRYKILPIPFDCSNVAVGLLVLRDERPTFLQIQSISLTLCKLPSYTGANEFASRNVLTVTLPGLSRMYAGDSGAALVYFCQDGPIVLGFVDGIFAHPLAGSGMSVEMNCLFLHQPSVAFVLEQVTIKKLLSFLPQLSQAFRPFLDCFTVDSVVKVCQAHQSRAHCASLRSHRPRKQLNIILW